MTMVNGKSLRISAAVMTHPRRIDMARRLCERHPELNLKIVTDPEPERGHSLHTALLAWRSVDPGASHHLVIQDDVILCDDFAALLHARVHSRPEDALTFFTEWGCRTASMVRAGAMSRSTWVESVDPFVSTLAAVLPADVARAFGQAETTRDPDDVMLHHFLSKRQIKVLVSVPNLVEHDDTPSLVGNGFQGLRHSACFAAFVQPTHDSEQVLGGFEWIPHMSWMRGVSECYRRDGSDPAAWQAQPTLSVLDPMGLATSARSDFTRAITAGWISEQIADRIAAVVLFELWLSGYVLGAILAKHGQTVLDLDSTTSALALASLAPGALRRFFAAPLLQHMSEPLRRFAALSVRAGHSAMLLETHHI